MKCHVHGSAVFAMVLTLALATGAGSAPVEPTKLRFDPQFILEQVARHLNIPIDPDTPVPAIFLESNTSLRRFQDAIEAQWGFRPRAFTNAYAVEPNEIYLTDDPRYYLAHNRTLDDSLAHELTHYLQRSHFRSGINSDWYEMQAVYAQEWFRSAFPRVR